MNLAVESDVQVMKKLFIQFQETKVESERADIIETLEYYVHQFDNALDFIQLEGFKLIVITYSKPELH